MNAFQTSSGGRVPPGKREIASLAAENEALVQLHEISARLVGKEELRTLLEAVVEAAITVSRADRATLQLYDAAAGRLNLVAHSGFQPAFLERIKSVDHDARTTCSESFRRREPVAVEDTSRAPAFLDAAAAQALAAAGVGAVQCTPLKGRGGPVLGLMTTYWNAPRRSDDSTSRILDLLARQAADLLERSQVDEALRAADRRKDEFLATLAHELRNGLAPLRSSLEVVQLSGSEAPAGKRACALMERQVCHLVRLVDDLLDISRIGLGKVALWKGLVDLAAIIHSAVDISQPLIEAGRHRLVVYLPPEPLQLDADAVRLTQVFANLLNNAAKYTEPGGVIRVTAWCEEDSVAVSVRDTGIGISGEALPQVFDLFRQADCGPNRAQGGLGIGLHLARSLVQLHDGRMEAHSAGPGKGSEFVVHLPLAAPAK